MDARTRAWLDQSNAQLTQVVRRHGWAVQYVGGGECSVPDCCPSDPSASPFAYTIGLFGLDHPELLISGLEMGLATDVLNELGESVRAGGALLPGREVATETWDRPLIPEPVPNPGDIVFTANRYYRRPDAASVPVLQLSYPDDLGRYPWDPRHASPDRQPRPGSFRA